MKSSLALLLVAITSTSTCQAALFDRLPLLDRLRSGLSDDATLQKKAMHDSPLGALLAEKAVTALITAVFDNDRLFNNTTSNTQLDVSREEVAALMYVAVTETYQVPLDSAFLTTMPVLNATSAETIVSLVDQGSGRNDLSTVNIHRLLPLLRGERVGLLGRKSGLTIAKLTTTARSIVAPMIEPLVQEHERRLGELCDSMATMAPSDIDDDAIVPQPPKQRIISTRMVRMLAIGGVVMVVVALAIVAIVIVGVVLVAAGGADGGGDGGSDGGSSNRNRGSSGSGGSNRNRGGILGGGSNNGNDDRYRSGSSSGSNRNRSGGGGSLFGGSSNGNDDKYSGRSSSSRSYSSNLLRSNRVSPTAVLRNLARPLVTSLSAMLNDESSNHASSSSIVIAANETDPTLVMEMVVIEQVQTNWDDLNATSLDSETLALLQQN